MARHKDLDWNLNNAEPNGKGGFQCSIDTIQAAVLMDIRDELRRINAVLACHNTQQIASILRRISRNTAKPRKPTTRGGKR
jgi:hypothetical protein